MSLPPPGVFILAFFGILVVTVLGGVTLSSVFEILAVACGVTVLAVDLPLLDFGARTRLDFFFFLRVANDVPCRIFL